MVSLRSGYRAGKRVSNLLLAILLLYRCSLHWTGKTCNASLPVDYSLHWIA